MDFDRIDTWPARAPRRWLEARADRRREHTRLLVERWKAWR